MSIIEVDGVSSPDDPHRGHAKVQIWILALHILPQHAKHRPTSSLYQRICCPWLPLKGIPYSSRLRMKQRKTSYFMRTLNRICLIASPKHSGWVCPSSLGPPIYEYPSTWSRTELILGLKDYSSSIVYSPGAPTAPEELFTEYKAVDDMTFKPTLAIPMVSKTKTIELKWVLRERNFAS